MRRNVRKRYAGARPAGAGTSLSKYSLSNSSLRTPDRLGLRTQRVAPDVRQRLAWQPGCVLQGLVDDRCVLLFPLPVFLKFEIAPAADVGLGAHRRSGALLERHTLFIASYQYTHFLGRCGCDFRFLRLHVGPSCLLSRWPVGQRKKILPQFKGFSTNRGIAGIKINTLTPNIYSPRIGCVEA